MSEGWYGVVRERERAPTVCVVGGTARHVKAMMTGVMLIAVRVMRFAPEPAGKLISNQ